MTANTSKITGFRPVWHLGGGVIRPRKYVIPVGDGTATFIGDAVLQEATGDASLTGVPSCAQATSSAAVCGVIVGMEPSGGTQGTEFMAYGSTALDTPVYRAASTRRVVWVVDDPMVVFEVQEDAVGGSLTFADVNLNALITVGSGSTTTGASAMQLDSSTAATGNATYPLKIVGFPNRPDNSIADATSNNSKVWVIFNNHAYGHSTGTVGV